MAKILLVEDDTNLSEIYEARMQAEGYVVVTAGDGEVALAVAAKEKPDLIISDVMMPKISGFEMLDILRNTEGLKTTPVIMLTALSQAEDKTRADALGANRYLVKSQVTLEDIVKTAQDLLGETGATPVTPPPPAAVVPTAPAPSGSLTASTPAAIPPPPIQAAPTTTPVPPIPVVQQPPAAAVPTPQIAVTPIPPPAQPAVPSQPAVIPPPVMQAPPVAADPTSPQPPVSAAPTPTTVPETIASVPPPTPAVPQPLAPAPNIPAAPASAQTTAQENAAVQDKIASFEQSSAPVQQANSTTIDDNVVSSAVDELLASASADQPSTGAQTPQPLAADTSAAGASATSTQPNSPAPAPTVSPSTSRASAPTPTNSVEVAHKKVISPITQASDKPNLDALLAKEQAKESGTILPKPTSMLADRPKPANPEDYPSGGSPHQPGSVLGPDSENKQAEPPKPGSFDHNSISL